MKIFFIEFAPQKVNMLHELAMRQGENCESNNVEQDLDYNLQKLEWCVGGACVGVGVGVWVWEREIVCNLEVK